MIPLPPLTARAAHTPARGDKPAGQPIEGARLSGLYDPEGKPVAWILPGPRADEYARVLAAAVETRDALRALHVHAGAMTGSHVVSGQFLEALDLATDALAKSDGRA